MPTRLSLADRNAHADLAADAVDASATPGYVEIYSGTQPETVATAPTGTMLTTITLNNPAYGSAVNGTAVMDVDPQPESTWLADYSGEGWFRLYDGDGVARRDGALPVVDATASGVVRLKAGSQVTMPAESTP